MYMSVEDQYFWECLLAISIGITFLVWYVKRSIDEAAEEQYQRGFYEGYDKGWYACRDVMWDVPDKKK